MSINITIKSGDNKPFAVDIERFPIEVPFDGPKVNLAVVPVGFIVLFVLYLVLDAIMPIVALPLVLMIGGGLAFILYTILRRPWRQSIVRFEKDSVVVTEAGLLKDTVWEERYQDFEGVMLRSRTAKSGRLKSTYQVIELKHADPKKTLPLFVELTKVIPEERWSEYSDLFNLPALRGDL